MDTRFCEKCGGKTAYTISERQSKKTVRGINFSYLEEYAVCSVCDDPIYVPEIHDANIERIEAAYRKAAGLISVDEIQNIMEKYNIAANPLSKIMGFGEVTIARYLAGQTPSKANSDKLLEVLASVTKFEENLAKAKDEITKVAFRKSKEAIDCYKTFSENPSEIEAVAQYLINQLKEVTPLALQKLLYFSQSFLFSIK